MRCCLSAIKNSITAGQLTSSDAAINYISKSRNNVFLLLLVFSLSLSFFPPLQARKGTYMNVI